MSSAAHKRFFKHDAFISYAHRDNGTGIVTALHDQLEECLFHSLHWEPSVWLDERLLDSDADLEQQIRVGLRTSAVLIIITSEVVESRKWCRDEMGWYLQEANLDRVAVERLYPVLLPFSDVERLPRWTRDLLGHRFPPILDPNRTELAAAQDWTSHGDYWRRLNAWFDEVSEGIKTVHSAYHSWTSGQQPDDT